MAPTLPHDVSLTGMDIQDRLWNYRFSDSSVRDQVVQPVTFYKGSVTAMPSEWTSTFAFIHQRFLNAGLKRSDWSAAICELYRCLRPGRYLQLTEYGRVDGGPCVERWGAHVYRLFDKLDLWLDAPRHLSEILSEAGFVDVERIEWTIPLATGDSLTEQGAADEIGNMTTEAIRQAFKTVLDGFIRNGWNKEEIEGVFRDLEGEWLKPPEGVECSFLYYTFIARKS